MHTVGTGADHG
uniref:Uncharacterized protein n=1 Tax=Anguilla anguilla TaxID=7936 RepID=A0A0E9S023_ANGAN